MTIGHYIVFIGASAALSSELATMKTRIVNARIVAPAAKKKDVGATEAAIDQALAKLVDEMAGESAPTEPARFSLWMYDPTTPEQFARVWKAFGHSAWVETVPRIYSHKVGPTKEFIQQRINEIRPLLHEISIATYSQRKSSPLSLPLRNFSSNITKDLKKYWYNELKKDKLLTKLRAFKVRFLQIRDKPSGGFRDDKTLIFKPAKDSECHGQPHPIGRENKSFACGRFRYGVALFAGFHYDVSSENSATIQCELTNAAGEIRAIKSEGRTYINIFPNDHLLPEN